jgi:hypothetical protein
MNDNQIGDGILSSIASAVGLPTSTRNPTIDPPKVRGFLEKFGNIKIESIYIYRTPVESTFINIINAMSFNTFKKAYKEKYDDLFHLGLVINGIAILDKRDVINITPYEPKKNMELKQVNLPFGFNRTILDFYTRTRRFMNDVKFTSYNPVDNNCQVFTKALLQANGLLTKEYEDFIMQDVITIFSKIPKFASKLTQWISGDVGAYFNRIIEGEGIEKKSYPRDELLKLLKS